MDKIIDLAKKLKALADRGVDGEKVNAQAQLERTMQKHGLTIEDIEGEKKEYRDFKVTEIQEQVFSQIVSSVIGGKFSTWKRRGKRQVTVLNVTAAEYVEIEMKYEFYWKLYLEELGIFRHAFFQRNNIFPINSEATKHEDLSPEEKERLLRVLEMASSIKEGKLLKALNK